MNEKILAFKCNDILNKKFISSKELNFLLENREKGLVKFILIDIQDAKAHRNLSITGTDVLFPISKMHLYSEVLEQLRHVDFVMYCKNGKRTAYMQRVMSKMGFMQGAILKGGILAFDGKTSYNTMPPNIL